MQKSGKTKNILGKFAGKPYNTCFKKSKIKLPTSACIIINIINKICIILKFI